MCMLSFFPKGGVITPPEIASGNLFHTTITPKTTHVRSTEDIRGSFTTWCALSALQMEFYKQLFKGSINNDLDRIRKKPKGVLES